MKIPPHLNTSQIIALSKCKMDRNGQCEYVTVTPLQMQFLVTLGAKLSNSTILPYLIEKKHSTVYPFSFKATSQLYSILKSQPSKRHS